MVIKAGNDMVVWSRVEYLPDLLEEALSVELSGTNKGILSEQDVFAFQGCIETKKCLLDYYLLICEQIQWFVLSSVEDDFDSVLEVD